MTVKAATGEVNDDDNYNHNERDNPEDLDPARRAFILGVNRGAILRFRIIRWRSIG